jgi:hypothetical protein
MSARKNDVKTNLGRSAGAGSGRRKKNKEEPLRAAFLFVIWRSQLARISGIRKIASDMANRRPQRAVIQPTTFDKNFPTSPTCFLSSVCCTEQRSNMQTSKFSAALTRATTVAIVALCILQAAAAPLVPNEGAVSALPDAKGAVSAITSLVGGLDPNSSGASFGPGGHPPIDADAKSNGKKIAIPDMSAEATGHVDTNALTNQTALKVTAMGIGGTGGVGGQSTVQGQARASATLSYHFQVTAPGFHSASVTVKGAIEESVAGRNIASVTVSLPATGTVLAQAISAGGFTLDFVAPQADVLMTLSASTSVDAVGNQTINSSVEINPILSCNDPHCTIQYSPNLFVGS